MAPTFDSARRLRSRIAKLNDAASYEEEKRSDRKTSLSVALGGLRLFKEQFETRLGLDEEGNPLPVPSGGASGEEGESADEERSAKGGEEDVSADEASGERWVFPLLILAILVVLAAVGWKWRNRTCAD